MTTRPHISELRLKGFRSIAEVDLKLRPINVLIGPNGSGKSNLVGFFRMLSHMMTREPNLQGYIAGTGGASTLLTDGPKVTPQLEAELVMKTEKGSNHYKFRLFHAAPDRLVFAEEAFKFLPDHMTATVERWSQVDAVGQAEPQIQKLADDQKTTARVIHYLLSGCKVFQFHDTSAYSRIRQSTPAHDNRYLREDGANLAAVLMRLRNERPQYYRRIVATVRMVAPFFHDFEFNPTEAGQLILTWTEQDADVLFGAHQASDGMLRAMALITLLLQPSEWLPSVIVIDEPELGLHPKALHQIAGLATAASSECQIIFATQSPDLLNSYGVDDVLVVERQGRYSSFSRLDTEELSEWLNDYTLSELWQKNVLGGRP